MSAKILIVEDSSDLANLLAYQLSQLGYEVQIASNSADALRAVSSFNPNLMLLDLGLPGLDGIEVCKQIRKLGNSIPVLIISCRASESEKVLGFECGADDYLTKPFGLREVQARVAALLRRANSSAPSDMPHGILEFGELRVDLDRRAASIGKKPIPLTPIEFDLLSFLALHAGKPFTRDELLTSVWNYQISGYDHTVNTHVNRLRAKLEKDPTNPRYVLTVRGVGYRFIEAHELSQRLVA